MQYFPCHTDRDVDIYEYFFSASEDLKDEHPENKINSIHSSDTVQATQPTNKKESRQLYITDAE